MSVIKDGLQPSDFPLSTLRIFEAGADGPFSVALADKWADAMIALGVETPEIFDIYALDGSEGHACAALVRRVLGNIGAWPDGELARLAIYRDIALGALLRREMTPGEFSMSAGRLASEILEATEGRAGPEAEPARIDMETFAEIDQVFAILAAYEDNPSETKYMNDIGLDPDDPYPWLIDQLRKAQMIDEAGAVIAAVWGAPGPR